jgi:hypothetical protein
VGAESLPSPRGPDPIADDVGFAVVGAELSVQVCYLVTRLGVVFSLGGEAGHRGIGPSTLGCSPTRRGRVAHHEPVG